MAWIIEGFCWNLINGTRSENDLKFRLAYKCVNDVGGMMLHSYCNLISDSFIVAIGNSNFTNHYTETFVNFTVNFQVNDCRLIPIIIPTYNQLINCNKLISQIMDAKRKLGCRNIEIKDLCMFEHTVLSIITDLYRI
jgi:hypothetical protein